MSHPTFHHNTIVCPHCGQTETVCLGTPVSETQTEQLIWCVSGHIGFLDRHDRYHYLMDNHEAKYIWKMVDLTKADRKNLR